MQNDFIDAWLGRKGGKRDLDEFLHLANEVRRAQWPLPIQFGLEVCYFPGCEAFVESRTKNLGLDFWLAVSILLMRLPSITSRSYGRV